MARLTELRAINYRALADIELPLGKVNVLFGPNGSGKSTILDTIWFFRDCALRGVEMASAVRNHGIGLLWDDAEEGSTIAVGLSTEAVEYELRLGMSAGRMEPYAGELLRSLATGEAFVRRSVGSVSSSVFYPTLPRQSSERGLREPEKLSLGLYIDFNPGNEEAKDLDRLLHSVRYYHSRSFMLHRLKSQGSESSYETTLSDRGENLWSALRNLHDRRESDGRYRTIMNYMMEGFPSFEGLRLEQTGPATVYAHFREKGRRSEIYASGASDGHVQLLLLLTALFAEGPERSAVILFDEPEVSLHPWPLAVFARAVREAANNWNKQVLMATHSPVLLSQFEVDEVLATQTEDGRTRVQRLSDMAEIKDLLEQYAAGSLYMAEVVGGQSQPVATSPER